MPRLWKSVGAFLLAALLVGSGTALASPPSWAHGDRGDAPPQQSSTPDSSASSSPSSTSSTDWGGLSDGRQVADAVYAAHGGGVRGEALAEAVHQVLLTEHADARGLSVAESVYAGLGPNGGAGGAPFTDIQAEAPWAQAAVDALHQAGVVNGTSGSTFSPDQPVTLAELATMLARLQAASSGNVSGSPSGTPSWAQSAMAWVEASGILAGEQGLGAPDAPLTRAQAVLMLINAAGLAQQASQQSGATISLRGTPPAWAHGALALAIQLGLLQGSGGQLLSNEPLTRAQMAVLLARLAVLEAEASGGGSTTSGV